MQSDPPCVSVTLWNTSRGCRKTGIGVWNSGRNPDAEANINLKKM